MAKIHDEYVLEDKASSSLSKVVSKMEQTAQASQNMKAQVESVSRAEKAAAKTQSELKSALKQLDSQIKGAQASLSPLLSQYEEWMSLGFGDMSLPMSSGIEDLGKKIDDATANIQELIEKYKSTETELKNLEASEKAEAEAKKQQQEAVKAEAAARREAEQAARAAAQAQAKLDKANKANAAAAKKAEQAAKKQAEAVKKIEEPSGKAEKSVRKLTKALSDMEKSKAASSLGRQFTRAFIQLFSISKLLNMLKNSMEVMPEEAQTGWGNLKNSVSETFQSVMSYLLGGMLPGMKKLTDALNSPQGQQFIAVFRELAFVGGQGIGRLLSLIGELVTKMGTDFQQMRGFTAMLKTGFDMLNGAVQWGITNWERISPVLMGVGGAILAVVVAQKIWNAVTQASPIFLMITAITIFLQLSEGVQIAIIAITAAIGVLNMVMNANPLLLIISAIGMIIMAIQKWVQAVGGIQVAWLIVVDALLTAWDYVKAGFFTGVAFVQNLIDEFILGWVYCSVAVQNVLGDLKAGALMLLQNLVNGAIDIINNFINVLNKIPGVEIAAIEHVTFGTQAALENEAAKQARAGAVEAKAAELAAARDQRDRDLDQMYQDAAAAHEGRQQEILAAQQAAQDNSKDSVEDFMAQYGDPMLNDASSVGSGVGGSLGSDVAAIKKEVSLSEEELKSLVDIAQREYINNINLTTQSPVIQVQGQNTGDTAKDRKDLADAIRDILLEQSSAATIRSTARVY